MGSNSHRAPTGCPQNTWGAKAGIKDHYQPVGPKARCPRATRARSRDEGCKLQQVLPSSRHGHVSAPVRTLRRVTFQIYATGFQIYERGEVTHGPKGLARVFRPVLLTRRVIPFG